MDRNAQRLLFAIATGACSEFQRVLVEEGSSKLDSAWRWNVDLVQQVLNKSKLASARFESGSREVRTPFWARGD